MKYCLFIFFRDFRIYDNTTLNIILSKKNIYIIPIFIFNPLQITEKNDYKSNNSIECLCKGLKDLNEYLKGKLHIFYGDIIEILDSILSIKKYSIIAFNEDITPFALNRGNYIKKWATMNKINIISKMDYTLVHPNSIMTQNGTYYKTFKFFYLKILDKSNEIIDKIENKFLEKNFIKIPNNKYSLNIKNISTFYKPNPNIIIPIFTRQHILNKLTSKHLDLFRDYAKIRDYPRYNTTLFSTYLKYGLISIREVYKAIYEKFGSKNELLRQLIWKEYYSYLMYNLPIKNSIGSSNFQEKNYKWENNIEYFKHWKNGTTGFPFIDACMNQLNKTGWMHNRGRLCVANFLVYCLLIDWKWGEKYFAQNLVDYDISQNNGNWQWCAGVGIDRKPYLRMYNPYSLIEKYDPECVFVKKWCPIYNQIPINELKKWNIYYKKYNINKPIIDYKKQRIIAKDFFK